MEIKLERSSEYEVKAIVIKQFQTALFVLLASGVTVEEIKNILEVICPIDKDGNEVDWGKKPLND